MLQFALQSPALGP